MLSGFGSFVWRYPVRQIIFSAFSCRVFLLCCTTIESNLNQVLFQTVPESMNNDIQRRKYISLVFPACLLEAAPAERSA